MPTHPSLYTITCLLYSFDHSLLLASRDYDPRINLVAGSGDYESGAELPTKSVFDTPVDARLQAVEGVHRTTRLREID
jgi:hypothetical protein